MAGRQQKAVPSRQIVTTISAGAHARLEYLAKMGMHGGDTPPEVARFLIGDGLARLWREGKIPDDLPTD
jgi:hypothetical protein